MNSIYLTVYSENKCCSRVHSEIMLWMGIRTIFEKWCLDMEIRCPDSLGRKFWCFRCPDIILACPDMARVKNG
jgi:hypothetical protein